MYVCVRACVRACVRVHVMCVWACGRVGYYKYMKSTASLSSLSAQKNSLSDLPPLMHALDLLCVCIVYCNKRE